MYWKVRVPRASEPGPVRWQAARGRIWRLVFATRCPGPLWGQSRWTLRRVYKP